MLQLGYSLPSHSETKDSISLSCEGKLVSRGEASIQLGLLLLCVCLLPTLSQLYANWAGQEEGVFVPPEVLTLFCAFSFVLFLQAFPFLLSLATTILYSFFLF